MTAMKIIMSRQNMTKEKNKIERESYLHVLDRFAHIDSIITHFKAR